MQAYRSLVKMNAVRGLVVISDQDVDSTEGNGHLTQLLWVVGATRGQLVEYLIRQER